MMAASGIRADVTELESFLKAVAPADRPYLPIVFFAFRVMVAIGLILLALAITGVVLR
jgi:cytochrome d ubiquinol oxidase subunit I